MPTRIDESTLPQRARWRVPIIDPSPRAGHDLRFEAGRSGQKGLVFSMFRQLLYAWLMVLAAAGAASAQTTSATTAAITGTVADDSAGILPGVTVNMSGPAMMGVQSTVTNETGAYRF